MSAILALLAAILHLSNLDVTAHVQSGHSVIDKVYELRAGNHVTPLLLHDVYFNINGFFFFGYFLKLDLYVYINGLLL